MINLCEIFCSIQGETTYAGYPCIFIRLAGCNLRCRYCDTTYSYETSFRKSLSDIIDNCLSYHPVKIVTITGGEPLLQKEVSDLFPALHRNGFRLLLETNGSILLKNVPEYVHKIVDIKSPGSGEEDSFLEENISYLNAGKDEIKFVLTSEEDYLWMKDKISSLQLTHHLLLASPAWGLLPPDKLAAWMVRDGLNIKLQLQLQKYIWPAESRGV